MAIVERYKSPDQILELIVDFTSGDWTIGFAGHAWHTHGDVLAASEYKGTPEEATRNFVNDILASQCPIAIWRIDGHIKRLAASPEFSLKSLDKDMVKYGAPGETVELRYWNGRRAVT